MKTSLLILFFFLINNCSFDKDSKYWNEDALYDYQNKKKLSKILEKTDDITKMTVEEYKIYIDDLTKKSKYPNINE
tara:strand:- start:810 stop:1037 length:228 start_codon:yes stop_codon:yes gene_type:complete